jgi:ribosomal protein S18 acetylase RimI-like enzyme
MRTEDYKEVCQIYLATFPSIDDDDYSAAWLNRCETSSTVLIKRFGHEAKIIGFGLVTQTPIAIAKTAEKKLWFLAVDAPHRSGGSGSTLLKAILATSPSLCLAPVNDEKIIAWYQKNGFEIVQRYPFIHIDIPTCLMSRVERGVTCSEKVVSMAEPLPLVPLRLVCHL